MFMFLFLYNRLGLGLGLFLYFPSPHFLHLRSSSRLLIPSRNWVGVVGWVNVSVSVGSPGVGGDVIIISPCVPNYPPGRRSVIIVIPWRNVEKLKEVYITFDDFIVRYKN